MSSATDEAAAQPGVRRLQEGDGRMLDATAVRLTSTSQIATPPSK